MECDSGRVVTLKTLVQPSAPQEDWNMGEDYVEEAVEEAAEPEVEVEMTLSGQNLSDEPNKYRVLRDGL
jgi:hypothetical protein